LIQPKLRATTTGLVLLGCLLSFFVIVNEGITLEQQAWLMAGVYLALALIIAILSESQFSRSPTASRVISPAI
jgi:hypothetical protein